MNKYKLMMIINKILLVNRFNNNYLLIRKILKIIKKIKKIFKKRILLKMI